MVDEDRLSPELGRLIDAVKAVVAREQTSPLYGEGVALLGEKGGIGVGYASATSVSPGDSAAWAALVDLWEKGETEVIAAAVASNRPGEDTTQLSPGTMETLSAVSQDLPVVIKRCGRWVGLTVADLACSRMEQFCRDSGRPLSLELEARMPELRAGTPEPEVLSPELEVVRIRRPDPNILERLASYDREAFGPLGLRGCDLAVMAEAGAVFVAKLGDQVVGSCQIMRMLDEPEFLYLVGFYIRPQWRGQKFGARFLELVMREARALGSEGIVLTVSPTNHAALALYRGFGFVLERVAPDFYGEGEDRIVLRLCFQEDHLTGSV
ncbi:MAG: GNAT family N-acetyltransferase [Thermoleophilia bacterium]|nr:GNAT family N-acetyltransferase [Thermoleophilia bacterium]